MISISVVIINYNYGRFLPSCIESVLSQTVSPLEIIVVDDGSVDDSKQVLEKLPAGVRGIVQPNRGHVEAVNTGFAQSKGDICLFLDADDRLYQNCLEEVARDWKSGDAKLQFCLDTIDENDVDQRMPFPYFPASLTPEEVQRRSCATGVYPWTVSSGSVFSRAFLAQLLPIDSSEIYRSPDGYLSKVAPLFGNVRSINKVLGAYRVHGKNAWAQSRGKFQIAPIARWVKFDRVLQAKFEALARTKGIVVVSAQDVRSVQQSEYRIILKRVDPNEYPYLNDTRFSLFRLGLESAFQEPALAPQGRLFWVLWIVCLLFAPTGVVKFLYRSFRGQSGRGAIARFVVRLSREPAP